MNSKLTGEGDDDDGEVPKKALQFSAITLLVARGIGPPSGGETHCG